eukprot:s1809_g23.t1
MLGGCPTKEVQLNFQVRGLLKINGSLGLPFGKSAETCVSCALPRARQLYDLKRNRAQMFFNHPDRPDDAEDQRGVAARCFEESRKVFGDFVSNSLPRKIKVL